MRSSPSGSGGKRVVFNSRCRHRRRCKLPMLTLTRVGEQVQVQAGARIRRKRRCLRMTRLRRSLDLRDGSSDGVKGFSRTRHPFGRPFEVSLSLFRAPYSKSRIFGNFAVVMLFRKLSIV